MQEKIVKSQKELNELIESNYDGLIVVKDTIEKINIFGNNKAKIAVSDSAQIGSVFGSAQIRYVSGCAQIGSVYGCAQIGSVYDSAQIGSVFGCAQIGSVYDSAQIGSVSGCAQIRSVFGSAQIRSVSGSAQIRSVFGCAQIRSVSGSAQIGSVSGSAQIGSVSGCAQIRSVFGSAQIRSVYDSAQIGSVSGSAQIRYVSGSAQIGSVYDSAQINICNENTKILRTNDRALIVFHNIKPYKFKKSKNVQVIRRNDYQENNFTLNKFINKYLVEKEGNYIYLYKSVKDDFTDHYTEQIKYEIGKIIKCPDWDADKNRECGGGLHLSPSPYLALSFNQSNKVLKCKVKISDCIMVKNPRHPTKVRCKKVEVIKELCMKEWF